MCIALTYGKEEVSTCGQVVRFYLEGKPVLDRAENFLCTGQFYSSSGTWKECGNTIRETEWEREKEGIKGK